MSERDPKLTELLDLLVSAVRQHERFGSDDAARRLGREIDALREYVADLQRENEELAQSQQRWCDKYHELLARSGSKT